MDRYEVSRMFGQGTFGRLYQARLRSDLTDEQLPNWIHAEATKRRQNRRRDEERQARAQERHEEGTSSLTAPTAANAVAPTPLRSPQPTRAEIDAIREEMLVIKEVPFQGLPTQEQQDILNEVRVMSAVSHPSFVCYYESFLDNGCLYIVMEFAEGGDLAQILIKQKPTPLSESELWRYFLQLLSGLSYLHSQRILHRDLKPANIFLDRNLNIKIGDLGLGRILGSKSVVARTNLGTPLYFSPELCMDQPYDEKSDVWSLGCLLYEMATFQPPFLASNQIALAKKIVHDPPAELPSTVSSELKFLVMRMLEKDPSKRPTIDQMLHYSPVKLRRENADLRQDVHLLRETMRLQQRQAEEDRRRAKKDTEEVQNQMSQEQQKADQQLLQAQKQYDQVFSLLQSAEVAHSTLISRLRSLESELSGHQQLFDQYQMQLAREQQEKQTAEARCQMQENQIKQQQRTMQTMHAQIEKYKQMQQQQQQQQQQQSQLPPQQSSPMPQQPQSNPQLLAQQAYHSHHPSPAHLPRPHPVPHQLAPPTARDRVPRSTLDASPATTSSTPSSNDASSSAALLASPAPMPSAHAIALAASPLPSKSASPAPTAVMQTPQPVRRSPHVSPNTTRTVKLTRTPGLGPALRVPLARQTQSPTKPSVAPTPTPPTVTPRKKTPGTTRVGTATSSASTVAAPAVTPMPRLEWGHVAHSPRTMPRRSVEEDLLRSSPDHDDAGPSWTSVPHSASSSLASTPSTTARTEPRTRASASTSISGPSYDEDPSHTSTATSSPRQPLSFRSNYAEDEEDSHDTRAYDAAREMRSNSSEVEDHMASRYHRNEEDEWRYAAAAARAHELEEYDEDAEEYETAPLHVHSAAEWSARLAAAASTTTPAPTVDPTSGPSVSISALPSLPAFLPSSSEYGYPPLHSHSEMVVKPDAWPLSAQQLDWILAETNHHYDNAQTAQ